MESKSLIETLEVRVTEVEWFGQQHQLRVEPHLYPKGLFKVQIDSANRYQISAYVDELRHDLVMLKNISLPLMRTKAANKLLQKINVLINAFRSQSLRRKKTSSTGSLLNDIDLVNDNVYAHMMKKNSPATNKSLIAKLEKQTFDMSKLISSRDQKQRAFQRATSDEQRQLLQKTVLELSKQIGNLEQQITRIKEELAKR